MANQRVRKRDLVEKELSTTKWRCARDIAERLGIPLPTVTSSLSTLYEMDDGIEVQMQITKWHNRPVKHYRVKV